ncbi:hypothetical protein LSM04_005142 [Trypanosoma melophagium]|nr:hypothetical protein LSM04_005142 [Trypanosoma melophagium]
MVCGSDGGVVPRPAWSGSHPMGSESAASVKGLPMAKALPVDENGNHGPPSRHPAVEINFPKGTTCTTTRIGTLKGADIAEEEFKIYNVTTWIPRRHVGDIAALEVHLRRKFDYWK